MTEGRAKEWVRSGDNFLLTEELCYPGTTVILQSYGLHRGTTGGLQPRYRVGVRGLNEDGNLVESWVGYSKKGKNAGRSRIFSLTQAKVYGLKVRYAENFLRPIVGGKFVPMNGEESLRDWFSRAKSQNSK